MPPLPSASHLLLPAAHVARAGLDQAAPPHRALHRTLRVQEGELAGPQTLLHMVDTVLYLEAVGSSGGGGSGVGGNDGGSTRMLRVAKNRHGTAGGVGVATDPRATALTALTSICCRAVPVRRLGAQSRCLVSPAGTCPQTKPASSAWRPAACMQCPTPPCSSSPAGRRCAERAVYGLVQPCAAHGHMCACPVWVYTLDHSQCTDCAHNPCTAILSHSCTGWLRKAPFPKRPCKRRRCTWRTSVLACARSRGAGRREQRGGADGVGQPANGGRGAGGAHAGAAHVQVCMHAASRLRLARRGICVAAASRPACPNRPASNSILMTGPTELCAPACSRPSCQSPPCPAARLSCPQALAYPQHEKASAPPMRQVTGLDKLRFMQLTIILTKVQCLLGAGQPCMVGCRASQVEARHL